MTKFNDLDTVALMSPTINSREQYLAWVTQWKAAYLLLTNEIRETKAARKPYAYEYRKPGTARDGAPKRVQIGPNPTYSDNAFGNLIDLREWATLMLSIRGSMKQMGIARKKAKFETAA